MAAQRGDDRREVQQLSDSQSYRTKVRADYYEALCGLNIRQKPANCLVSLTLHGSSERLIPGRVIIGTAGLDTGLDHNMVTPAQAG